MATLAETNDYPDGIYQLEQSDPVLGGAPNEATGAGMDNIPHQQLAKRTNWLKSRVDALLEQVVAASSTVAGVVRLSSSTVSASVTEAATPAAVKAVNDNAETRALKTTTISAGGLATGGGNLSANRTIDVPVATEPDAEAGLNNTRAMTPLRVTQAVAAKIASGTLQAGAAILTALSALPASGLVVRTGAGTVAARTLMPGAGIAIDNGDGVAGNPTVGLAPAYLLDAISDAIASTAVDVIVYDTSHDSDGGAWRGRCLHTSWQREGLNTATRGARREFPAVVVIVAEAAKVTIHDGDDPALPMWKVIDFTGYSVTSLAARDGAIVVGLAASGVALLDFPRDRITASPRYATPATIANTTRAVAIAALPGASVTAETGLPTPTIAVATDGDGTYLASLIKSNGTTYDIGTDGGFSATAVAFREDGALVLIRSDGTVFVWNDPGAIAADGAAPNATYSASSTPALLGTSTHTARGRAFGSASGLALMAANPAAPASGMVARITTSYTSGWMQGAIRGAWLASTDTTDLVGGIDADRSGGADLTVTGTLARSAVATGSELVGYSGFSAANYLAQPYNAALDFGTGDFCVMGWARRTGAGIEYLLDRGNGVNDTGRIALAHNSGNLTVAVGQGAAVANTTLASGAWAHICLLRASGTATLYLNGEPMWAGPRASTVSVNGPLRFGISQTGASAFGSGSMALWRMSGTAPTADQVRHIYETERALFQPGAQCTFYGASDAVTALANDPVTGLLHVGTSAGRSDFQGLARVANTTTAVTTAISAAGGMISEQ